MLTFDVTKKKKLEMMIETQGIDTQSLTFTFRILIEGVEYGFPCHLLGDRVTVEIPPLSEVLSKQIETGNYNAKLEVAGADKYYLKPFDESVHIKIEPKVEVKIEEEKDVIDESAFSLKLSRITDEDSVDEKSCKKKDKKKLYDEDGNEIEEKSCKKDKKKPSKLSDSLK